MKFNDRPLFFHVIPPRGGGNPVEGIELKKNANIHRFILRFKDPDFIFP